MRAAHERKRPVVNARNARCQKVESNFIGEGEGEAGTCGEGSSRGRRCTERTNQTRSRKASSGTVNCQPPESQRSIEPSSNDSSTIGLVM
jgi:hypothetical protein